MKHFLPQKRMDKPIMIRLSAQDREKLEALSAAQNVPMATIAYFALRQWLEEVEVLES